VSVAVVLDLGFDAQILRPCCMMASANQPWPLYVIFFNGYLQKTVNHFLMFTCPAVNFGDTQTSYDHFSLHYLIISVASLG